jgi:glucose dehydrogenase
VPAEATGYIPPASAFRLRQGLGGLAIARPSDSAVGAEAVRRKILLAIPAIALTLALTPAQTAWQSPSRKDFPTVGGNLANQRYSALKRITKANIGRLGGAWSVHLEDGKSPGTMQATPVVVGGVMFIASGGGTIFAIDAAAGAIKW